MKHPITVLICVHSRNDLHDELLLKALKSLQIQTFKNFKTLIVLDECWDYTENKILNYKFEFEITLIKKEKKEHLSQCKNIGLSLVDTEFVAFLDGDDLYIETKLEKQMEFLSENSVDFLGTQAWVVTSTEKDDLSVFKMLDPTSLPTVYESCFKLNTNETHDEIKQNIYGQNFLTHGSMIIRMSALRELNFYSTDPEEIGFEDWNLWVRAIKHGFKFHQIQERLYVYRIGSSVPR